MKFKSKQEAIATLCGTLCIPFAAAREKEPVFARALLPPLEPPYGFSFEKFGQGTWLISEIYVSDFEDRLLRWTREVPDRKVVPFMYGTTTCLNTSFGSVLVTNAKIYRNIVGGGGCFGGYVSSEGGFLIPHIDFLIESYVDKSLMVDPPEEHIEILKGYIQGDSREAVRCRMSLGW